MKALIPSFLFLFVFTACQKGKITDPTELTYKSKFEQLLKIDPQSNNKVSANTDVVHFNFGSYEEAYNYFKFLESKQPFTHIDTAYSNFSNGSQRETAAASDWRLISYSVSPSVSTTVPGSFGISSILLMYSLFYQIGFSTTNTSTSILANNPGSSSLFYAGIGTASGTATISGQSHSQSGTINGGMQGEATIAGVSSSFFIVISGTYSFSVPATAEGTSLVTTSIYASSSTIGGGTTPPLP